MSAKIKRGLFVTGTDTGVGKSLVTAALARLISDRGLRVGILKPAETGVENPEQLGADGKLLKWAARSQQTDAQICPYRLKEPLAPAYAASREHVRINFTDLLEQARQTIAEHDFTLVEGAGGLMVPLAGGLLISDFALALQLPTLVVCRPGLGTINHTLLTLFAAKTMELEVAGYLINNMPAIKTSAEESVGHSLASMTSDDLLGILDAVSGNEQEKVVQLAALIPQMPTYSLLSRYLPG